MSRFIHVLVYISLPLLLLANSVELRSTDGKAVRVRILSFEDESATVTISHKEKKYTLPLSNFDEDSQRLIRAWNPLHTTASKQLPPFSELPSNLQSIPETINDLIESGLLVGAQVAVADGNALLLSHAAGKTAIGGKVPVSTDTLFLIASASKPFALTTILRMFQHENYSFNLDDQIDEWLPTYPSARIVGGDLANAFNRPLNPRWTIESTRRLLDARSERRFSFLA